LAAANLRFNPSRRTARRWKPKVLSKSGGTSRTIAAAAPDGCDSLDDLEPHRVLSNILHLSGWRPISAQSTYFNSKVRLFDARSSRMIGNVEREALVACDGGAVRRILVAAEGKTRMTRHRDANPRLKMICRRNVKCGTGRVRHWPAG